MVLYKRKQVTYVRPPPVPTDLNTEIYVIPQTKEWFLNYEDYLARIDYYNRRKFVCEITGNSCLTYYQAYESETKEISDVEANFPEALREHILKYLQFNRISRLDLLVDKVYSEFKNEYFPGEEVFVKRLVEPSAEKLAKSGNTETPSVYVSSVKQRGFIREKVQYSNPSDTKYLVSTVGDNGQIIATNQQLFRDRNHFTKWLVKTYVKLTVTRSHKIGAPWVVKDKYAKKYRIPKEFPEDLKQFEAITPTGETLYEGDERADSPSPAVGSETGEPVAKVKKPRGRAALKIKKAALAAAMAAQNGEPIPSAGTEPAAAKTREKDARVRFPVHHLPESVRLAMEKSDQSAPYSVQPSKKTIVDDLRLAFDLQTARPAPRAMVLPANAKALNMQVADMLEAEITEAEAEAGSGDDTLKISEKHAKVAVLRKETLHCVQEALECWTFLNIYHSVLKLDTFTFDDFLCAMGWNDTQLAETGRCELLDEVWCAVLGLVVSNEPASSKASDDHVPGLQIALPPDVALLNETVEAKKDAQDDDVSASKGSDSESEPRPLKIEDDASENDSASPSPHKAKARVSLKLTLNSNSRKGRRAENQHDVSIDETSDGENADNFAADADADADAEMEDTAEAANGHNAYTVTNYRGVKWHEKLRKRNFKDGNWLLIVMGVLSLVEYVPEYADTIGELYATLAPAHISPATPATVLAQFYSCVGIDLRLKVLHILTTLVVNGSAVRTYMDESLDSTTILRRTRLDIIREWRSHVETANKLHSEVYQKLMEHVGVATDLKLWSGFSRKRHRLNTKGYEMTEYEKSVVEAEPAFQELWDAREAAIAKIRETRSARKDVEMQLSQLDCQRVKLLGRDRHFNRYWWFENNGLPNVHYSGDGDEDDEQQEPESDDEDEDKDDFQTETYLMGCLWIQGPNSMDVSSHVKLTAEEAESIVKNIENGTSEKAVKVEDDSDNHATSASHQNGSEASSTPQPFREMDFSSIPDAVVSEAAKKGVDFSKQSVKISGASEVIDKLGGLPADFDVQKLSAVQRKFIEEQTSPLFSAKQWRYFDQVDDVDNLIKWLNPWGRRESSLRKEFLRVREGMTASIAARRKALWLDKLPKEEAELEGNIEAVESKIENHRNGVVEELEPEESVDESAPRKRPNRRGANGGNKRQKTAEETLKSGTLPELETLQDELKESLAQKISENQITRVTEWVNRTARDELEKSLYEGGDRNRTRGRKPKK